MRILSPADFGIAALTNIIMTLFMMISEAGTEKYAIKAEQCTDELLNSAWSLNLTLKCGCGILLSVFSGVVADFIQEPQLRPVLLLLFMFFFFFFFFQQKPNKFF